MEPFKPIIKAKKNVNHKKKLPLFPSNCLDDQSVKKFNGIFTGISVEIVDQDEMKRLYSCGCYGKGSKSRGGPTQKINETLSLDLEEAFFLAYILKVLKICNLNKEEMQCSQFMDAATTLNSQFEQNVAAYMYLKSKGWVIKSGIKFGGNFLIYKKGPRFYHASFVVLISKEDDLSLLAKDAKGMQRIAETSDKDVLVLQVHKALSSEAQHETCNADLQYFKNFIISETIMRRFNYTSFVQSHNRNITNQ